MRASVMLAAAGAALALLAGCGSSSKSTSTTATTASGSTSTSSTAASSRPAYGAGSRSAASSGGTAASGTSAVAVTTKHAAVGTVLAAGPKHLTVYLFEADKGPASACSGACASAWPPVRTSGTPKANGAASASHLGTITRPDGTKQVTYNGHPLYYFIKDKDQGDSYGQGVKAFGASWYALAPSGNKIDAS